MTVLAAAPPGVVPMLRYAYQARDQRGQVVAGVVSATTLADATRQLRSEGKYVIDIKPARPGATIGTGESNDANAGKAFPTVNRHTRVPREELIHFTLQLSVMVDTGVPLSDALHALSEQVVSDAFSGVLKSIDHEVAGGRDI